MTRSCGEELVSPVLETFAKEEAYRLGLDPREGTRSL
jgi:hypothetical protein